MKTYKSSSTVYPPEWDTASSATTVYHNYDVEEIPATDDMPVTYEYTVDHYSREEYNRDQPQLAQAQAEIANMQGALADADAAETAYKEGVQEA